MSWSEWKYEAGELAGALWDTIVAHRAVVIAALAGFVVGAWCV